MLLEQASNSKKKNFYDLYKDRVFLITPFLHGMFKLTWIIESLLPDPAKEQICQKIKKLIFDHAVVVEYGNQTSASDHIELVQKQQLQNAQSTTISALKRKSLFSNIQNDQTYSKK